MLVIKMAGLSFLTSLVVYVFLEFWEENCCNLPGQNFMKAKAAYLLHFGTLYIFTWKVKCFYALFG